MSGSYEPKSFWEQRLSKYFNLKGVGRICFSESYNYWLYRRKKRCLETYMQIFPEKGLLPLNCLLV